MLKTKKTIDVTVRDKGQFKLKMLWMAFLASIALCFTSCDDDDDDVELPKPTIDNIQVGTGNNEIGVIGNDLHFNAKVLAGDKVDTVRIRIQPRLGEEYTKDWSFEIKWDEFKGLKNPTCHKHFDIPDDAAEGIFDFIVIVEDENGTVTEEVRTINIYAPENLPGGNIRLNSVEMWAENADGSDVFVYSYVRGTEKGDRIINMNDTLKTYFNIRGVNGDGALYLLLSKRKFGQRPESVKDIDYTKTIVMSIATHTNIGSTVFHNISSDIEREKFFFGAEVDGNEPTPNPIDGNKTLEAGDYILGVIYENTTNKRTIAHYLDVKVVDPATETVE